MQVVLQALLGGATLLAPDMSAGLPAAIGFLVRHGCTHLSATPSLWRKLLMTPECGALPLIQITLGGEIADQAILGALATRYPGARIVHIYASTEIGVGFSVRDKRPGFPATYLTEGVGETRLRVTGGELWLRPPGNAARLASAAPGDIDSDGFMRTGDLVRLDGDRVYFLGRDSNTVNIGGTKVHPEDVEAIVNAHPGIAACQVTARPSPIVGAILALQVAPVAPDGDAAGLAASVRAWCREHLPREAQPATIKIVAAIETSAAGKISRLAPMKAAE